MCRWGRERAPFGRFWLLYLGLQLVQPHATRKITPFPLWVVQLGEWSPKGTSAPPCPLPLCSTQPAQPDLAALLFLVAQRMPARKKGVPFHFKSPFQVPLKSDKEGKVGVGWGGQGWGGPGLRGTEGRPGIISSPSVQTHMCAVGPYYLPRQSQQPALPWVPTPACTHTLPPGEPHRWRASSTPPFPHHPCLPPAPSTSPELPDLPR